MLRSLGSLGTDMKPRVTAGPAFWALCDLRNPALKPRSKRRLEMEGERRALQCNMHSRSQTATFVGILILSAALISCSRSAPSSNTSLPRTADGKPDLSGIWQVHNRAAADLEDHVARFGMPAGKGVVQGGQIPYQEWAAKKKIENAKNRADRRSAGEVLHARRAAHHVHGVPVPDLPDARSHRDDVRVVAGAPARSTRTARRHSTASTSGWATRAAAGKATRSSSTCKDHNDRTWFDTAGNFHSEALHARRALHDDGRRHDSATR